MEGVSSPRTLSTLFGPKGPLASAIPGFSPRPQQNAVADAMERGLKEGRPVLAEAGTGVGKTVAYLVPLLRWLDKTGGKAVVSTHTLALQSQLVERDVPNLLRAFPELNIRPIALKGRQNYLCLQDLDVATGDLLNSGDPQFKVLQRWASETDSGDVAELDFTWPGWSEVAANADSCRGRECRYYDRCFYYKARKSADESNLFLVNHALFFADLRLKRANPNGPTLIPSYDAVIFDEAHHVEDIATRAFGLEWGSGRLPYLLNRARKVDGVEEHTLSAIDALHSRLLTPFVESHSQEAFLEELAASDDAKKSFMELRNQVCSAIDSLATALARAADRASAPTERDRASGLARTASRLSSELGVIEPTRTDEHFHWYNVRKTRNGNVVATLTRTPYEISAALAETLLARTSRLGFVSATLSAGEGEAFGYLKSRLGLGQEDAPAPIEIVQGSPFDFAKNCLLYVPRHLGPPSHAAEYAEAALAEMESLIALSGGRTFALFTSHRMLKLAAARWQGNIPYPLFIQGDQPGGRLVESFVASGNGVLLGASSFWEGVDVPGDALSLVILDKLPFATPDSPPQRAREERLIESGGNAFSGLSLPQATLRLKQGFGRLLRTQTDRGVVAILDERLWTKHYGKKMLAALPACPKTDDIERVRRFFDPNAVPIVSDEVTDDPFF